MLILNIIEENGNTINEKRFLRKRRKPKSNESIRRENLSINGINVVVIDIPYKRTGEEEFIKLLKIYKGRVLVSECYSDLSFLQEYLFNDKEYRQRAVLSSFVKQIKTINKEWKSLCIKIDVFKPYKEFFDVVNYTKNVSFLTTENHLITRFINDCYYELGAIISVNNAVENKMFDVFLHLEEIDKNGKLMIDVRGKGFLLYPDMTYFQNVKDYEKLIPYNIEHNKICAAFSNK